MISNDNSVHAEHWAGFLTRPVLLNSNYHVR